MCKNHKVRLLVYIDKFENRHVSFNLDKAEWYDSDSGILRISGVSFDLMDDCSKELAKSYFGE